MILKDPNEINFLETLQAEFLKLFGNLGYRKKVCAVIVDDKRNFLIDQLTSYGDNQWNFSGGGIEEDETPKKALLRELKEELGSTNFKIIKESNIVSKYNWPNSVIIKRLKKDRKTWRGQEAIYFLVEYLGKKEDLKPDPEEIRKIKWIKKNEFSKYFIFTNQTEETELVLKDLQI
ncbi:MAG: NUDIX domain-containing protein [Patescibacteria group bacterium]